MAVLRQHQLSTGDVIHILDRTEETAGITHTMDQRHIFANEGRTTTRDPSGINQIVLHHTGFTGRDDHRFDYVMAHYAVRLNGEIFQLRAHTARLQASADTRRAIDIEFEGSNISSRQFRDYLNHLVRTVPESEWVREFEFHMADDFDDNIIMEFLRTHAAADPRGPSVALPAAFIPPVEQILAGRLLVRYLVETVRSIQFIYAHQQIFTEGDRSNCPGPHIWFNVGKWAKDNLGLRNADGLRPIPVTTGRWQIGWEDERFRLI